MKSEEKGAEALFFVQKGRNAEVVPFGVREGTSYLLSTFHFGLLTFNFGLQPTSP